ncbi:hypothetical protein POX_g09210 [Penicillium oxalicum]|uniref:Methyltransferase domain-containing protein n=1 Tax=Penicillium oxalicum (strain 114-2 / CGMCC 5302) TaxID=933388 RepID=S7Z8H0_PENO1|nr:hypothetical protein POX_g09210 [Penicillium oxalicum]EPS26494.1 hypothetical protein PDE_01431 [Penicillium oxalicum 114-2]KAI2786815.1 hypothetical protein POX_g09210 [Penicillium oxalicum]
MWLNVGFWKNNPSSFQEACQHLFEEILSEAGISKDCSHDFSIIEVGCGCAETAFFMRGHLPHRLRDYIGITINDSQAKYAKDRLQSLVDDCLPMWEGRESPLNEVFKADAADPDTWPSHVHDTIDRLIRYQQGPKNNEKIQSDIWLLAIDTLYHFKPSRHGILKFAHQEIGASFMATDIIISSSLSIWNRILLRILFYFLYVPWTNILTREEYVSMLAACGYEKENIQIRDITDHCFPGYDQFLARQGRDWERIGGSPAVFRPMLLMGRVTAWWARSATIRECIIIAKKSGPVP